MYEYVLELNKQKIYVVDAHDDRVLTVKRTEHISKAKKFTSRREAYSWKYWIEGVGWLVTVKRIALTYAI